MCKFGRCDNKAQTRGYCKKHYDYVRNIEKETGVREDITRPLSPEWEAASVAANHRLKIEAAKAKIAQALLILHHPDRAFPQTLEEVLGQVLADLEGY